jgi:hypothetical protein
LTGKPDEVVRQRARVAVLDHKYGSYRGDDPRDDVQLGLYALLVAREDDRIEEATCQILSPYYDFEPVTYGDALNGHVRIPVTFERLKVQTASLEEAFADAELFLE